MHLSGLVILRDHQRVHADCLVPSLFLPSICLSLCHLSGSLTPRSTVLAARVLLTALPDQRSSQVRLGWEALYATSCFITHCDPYANCRIEFRRLMH